MIPKLMLRGIQTKIISSTVIPSINQKTIHNPAMTEAMTIGVRILLPAIQANVVPVKAVVAAVKPANKISLGTCCRISPTAPDPGIELSIVLVNYTISHIIYRQSGSYVYPIQKDRGLVEIHVFVQAQKCYPHS